MGWTPPPSLLSSAYARLHGPASQSKAIPPQGAVACVACHGAKGQGAGACIPAAGRHRPGLPAGSAGSFRSGARKNPVMQLIAQKLDAAQRTAVMAYYSQLPAPPTSTAKAPTPADPGGWLAARGRWTGELPACAQCHGADGSGGGQFPLPSGYTAARQTQLRMQVPTAVLRPAAFWPVSPDSSPRRPARTPNDRSARCVATPRRRPRSCHRRAATRRTASSRAQDSQQ